MARGDDTTAHTGGLSWNTILTIAMGNFITGASVMFMVLALPAMAIEFESPIFVIIWVMLAYTLMTTSLAVPMGKIGDLYGRRTIFITGFIIFTIMSLLATTASSAEALVGYRILQGIGASMTVGLGQALVAQYAPPEKRGRSLGITSAGWGVGALAGPVMGGVILQMGFGWKPLFLMLAVFGAVITILSITSLPRIERPKEPRQYDWKGALLFATSLATLLIAMTIGMGGITGSSLMMPLYALSAVSFILFIYTELKNPQPMFDLRLLKMKLYGSAIGLGFLDAYTTHVISLVLTFYLQGLRGFDPIVTASVLVIGPIFGLLDPVGGWLADKLSPIVPITTGFALRIVGFILLAEVGVDVSIPRLMMVMGLIGFSAMLTWTPTTTMGLGSIPKRSLGTGAGLVYSSRIIGGLISQAMAVMVLAMVIGQLLDVGKIFTRSAEITAGDEVAVFSGILAVYQLMIVASIISVIFAIYTLRRSRRIQAEQETETG